jgi:NAD(P)-dependent dehydrogenase (short-subunit alcohol dehydrogenase family)
MLLENQRVVVTGAARGIGLAVATACARAGARVHLLDRLAEELSAARERLAGEGLEVESHVLDLADPAAVQSLFGQLLQRHGRIDGLVNNAGTTVYGGALDTSLEELRRVLDIHLAPTLLCAQAVAPSMLAAGRGRIVNMASAAAPVAVTRFFAYAMAKAAVIALTQQMATEFGSRGVTVNALAPGPVMTEALRGNQNLRVQQALRDDIPMDRFAEPDEVAGAAVFLLSGLASYVNGHVLAVDGGLLAAGTRLDRVMAAA